MRACYTIWILTLCWLMVNVCWNMWPGKFNAWRLTSPLGEHFLCPWGQHIIFGSFIDLLRPRAGSLKKQHFTMFYGKPVKKWGQNVWSVLLQNRPGAEFLATAQVCCVLLPKNILYANINRPSSTIPPYWLIKSFHSTTHMYFCPQKMASEVPRPRSQGVCTLLHLPIDSLYYLWFAESV